MMYRNAKFKRVLAVLFGAALTCGMARAQAAGNPAATADFAPLEQWKSAVIAGDAAALKALYSSDPATEVRANGTTSDADGDIKFWLSLKASSIKLEIVRSRSRADGQSIIFQATVATAQPNHRIVNVSDAVAWQKQGDQWRIRYVERTDEPHLMQPSDMKKDLYPADADAHAEIKEAKEKAATAHKRLLLVFGANWCYDCHVLDLAFHRPDFADVMAGYEVVHVDLGLDEKKNADLVAQYEIPLNKGIPALAVAESDGKLVVSQKNGEFENARGLTPATLLEFLNKWKPGVR